MDPFCEGLCWNINLRRHFECLKLNSITLVFHWNTCLQSKCRDQKKEGYTVACELQFDCFPLYTIDVAINNH